MKNDQQFEDEVLPEILANKSTCRALIRHLADRCGGIKLQRTGSDAEPTPVNVDDLTHGEMINIASRVWIELKRREAANEKTI